MAETNSYNPNILKRGSVVVIAAVGLVACGQGKTLAEQNPKERFVNDYVWYSGVDGEVDCLYHTAYDLSAGDRGRASVTPPSATYNKEKDILTITPASGQNPLHVEGFEQFKHRVTPVGSEDQAIFDSYGCESETY